MTKSITNYGFGFEKCSVTRHFKTIPGVLVRFLRGISLGKFL
jgi:hypothetical protein